jgi:uncharacterized tellurite resistance protein B-like protein
MTGTDTLDLSTLAEDERLAFYSCLFAMSAVDRDMDEAEDDRIFESLDLGGLTPESRKRVFQLAIQPPPLERCLLRFRDAEAEIRRALLLNLLDVVLADGIIEPDEHVGLHEAREILGIARDDMALLHELASSAQEDGADVKRPIRPTPLVA